MVEIDNIRIYREFAEYYDLFADDSGIPLYLSMAEKYGSPVLDLACGTGRVAVKLAEAGHEVVGIDATKQMLEVAQKKADSLPDDVRSRISFLEEDFRSFELQRRFPLVIIPFSFHYCLTTDQQLACLSSIKRHLVDDGVFILDIYPEACQEEKKKKKPKERRTLDGKTVKVSTASVIDFSNQIRRRTTTVEIKHPNGETRSVQSESVTAIIFNREADLLLRLSGFRVLEEYGNWDLQPYGPGMTKRILVLGISGEKPFLDELSEPNDQ